MPEAIPLECLYPVCMEVAESSSEDETSHLLENNLIRERRATSTSSSFDGRTASSSITS